MHYIGLEAHALTSKQTTNESGAVRYGLSSFQVRNHEGARHCRKPLGWRSVTKGPISSEKIMALFPLPKKCAELYPKLHILNFRAIEHCCCDQFKKSVYRTFSHTALAERLSTVSSLFMVKIGCLMS